MNDYRQDYQRIARLIRHIDTHKGEQPALNELAAEAGLSPFHFHRLFSTWAGVTPKDFLQCLTLAHARRRLRDGESVLAAAIDAGLSGPGRLHDLTVSLDAATPGEIKSGGDGWVIASGFTTTAFGDCLIAESPRGICHLAFLPEGMSTDEAVNELQNAWPRATLRRDDARAAALAAAIFVDPSKALEPGTLELVTARRAPSLRVLVRGSAFQVRVWRALMSIPPGSLVSYGGLATSLGSPRAARAVGSAVARNTVGYLVPCHRVIRETGVVGEYRWGRERKRAMLAWEGARHAPPHGV